MTRTQQGAEHMSPHLLRLAVTLVQSLLTLIGLIQLQVHLQGFSGLIGSLWGMHPIDLRHSLALLWLTMTLAAIVLPRAMLTATWCIGVMTMTNAFLVTGVAFVVNGVKPDLYLAYFLVGLLAGASTNLTATVTLTAFVSASYATTLAVIGPVTPGAFLLIPILVLGAALYGGRTDHAMAFTRRTMMVAAVPLSEGQIDTLTRLPTRAAFIDRVWRSMHTARKHADFRFAILFVDLDGFKPINDKLGHKAGDAVLAETAHRLEVCLRKGDMVARYGGDEFTLIVDNVASRMDAVRVVERILRKVPDPIQFGAHKVHVGASIGVALSTNVHERPEDLIRDADTAMYRAKEQGKGRYEFSDQIRDATIPYKRVGMTVESSTA